MQRMAGRPDGARTIRALKMGGRFNLHTEKSSRLPNMCLFFKESEYVPIKVSHIAKAKAVTNNNTIRFYEN